MEIKIKWNLSGFWEKIQFLTRFKFFLTFIQRTIKIHLLTLMIIKMNRFANSDDPMNVAEITELACKNNDNYNKKWYSKVRMLMQVKLAQLNALMLSKASVFRIFS